MSENAQSLAEFILSYMKDGYDQETKRTEVLDSKANLVVTISSFLTGILLALISLAFKDLWLVFAKAGVFKLIVGILFILSESCFLSATFFSVWASRIKAYRSSLVYQADDIDNWLKIDNQNELKTALSKQFQEYWLHNRVENDSKARWLVRSTILLSSGAIILSIGTIIVLTYLLIWVNL